MKKIVIPLLLGLFAIIPHHLPAASYKSIIVNQSDGSEMKVTIEDDMKTAVAEGKSSNHLHQRRHSPACHRHKKLDILYKCRQRRRVDRNRIADRKRNKLHTQLRQNHSQ